jgi:hypothetical protein
MLITREVVWKRAESPRIDATVNFWGGPRELRRLLLLREEALGSSAEISGRTLYRIFPGGSQNTPVHVTKDIQSIYSGVIETLSCRAIEKAIAFYQMGHTLDLEMRSLLEQVDAQNLRRVS